MLSTLRGGLNTWPARLFFGFLVLLFVAWGVGGDLLRLIGGSGDTAVAHIGDRRIEMPELQEAYRRQLAAITRALGGRTEPSAALKQGIAAQALNGLVTQYAMTDLAQSLHLAVPEEALRQATYAMPAFHAPNGQFDRRVFEAALRNNEMTEPRFLGLLRQDLLQRQLLEPLHAAATSPDILTREIYAFQHERRIADAVDLPFAAAAAPPAPTEAQLTRWYENHKDQYSTPERRHIKAVILSPATVGRDIQVTDEELHAAYDQAKASMTTLPTRSAAVVLMPDEAKAKALTAQWQAGADWNTIQATARQESGSTVDITDSTREQIPSPELAQAIFSAPAEGILPPVSTGLGWYAVKVTKITPGATRSFEQARDELRARLIADKAADIIYDRANKIDDLLSGGVTLDNLPDDLGLAAVTGTLDAQGDTPEGQPAPIPGGDEVRKAVTQTAFQMRPGDPPRLTQLGGEGGTSQTFYSVVVNDITAPTPKPQAEVADQVRKDWTEDAIHHEQEERAAAILSAVKGGQSLDLAAAGLPVHELPPASRAAPAQGVPQQLLNPLFGLKVGEPTMVETADGFTVAVLAKIDNPDPNADPIGYGQVRDALSRSIASDIDTTFSTAVRDRAKPTVNEKQLASLTQQAD